MEVTKTIGTYGQIYAFIFFLKRVTKMLSKAAIWSGIFIVLGLGICVQWIIRWRRQRLFHKHAIQVEGMIVDRIDVHYAVVQFYDITGRMQEAKLKSSMSSAIGDRLPIYYDPNNPQVIASTKKGIGCFAIIGLIVGAIFIIQGAFLLFFL